MEGWEGSDGEGMTCKGFGEDVAGRLGVGGCGR